MQEFGGAGPLGLPRGIGGYAQLLLPKLVSRFWLAETPMETPAGAGQPQEAGTEGKGSCGAAVGQRWGCFSACPVSVLLC